MGDLEVLCLAVSTTVLSALIYNLLNSFMFRNLIRRFGLLKQTRKDFYECGFRPVTQKPIRIPLPFLLICVFFLLYDIELIFMFPFTSSLNFSGFRDTLLFVFFWLMFAASLVIDFTRHALFWQY